MIKPIYLDTHVLLVAAGVGKRFQDSTPDDVSFSLPKVYNIVQGKTLLEHAYHTFISCGFPVNHVHIVVSSQNIFDHEKHDFLPIEALIIGGDSRQESVFLGLKAIQQKASPQTVCIHDAARPFLLPSLLQNMLSMANDHDCIVPVIPTVDTLVKVGKKGGKKDFLKRQNIYRVQTPQIFPFIKLLEVHKSMNEQDYSDDAQMMQQAGYTLTLTKGDPRHMKVTHYRDIASLTLGNDKKTFTVQGYDIHPFSTQGELVLGGVIFPDYPALAGHSDGDVLLHALCDAMLSSCKTDLGEIFPSSDKQWHRVSSTILLNHTLELFHEHDHKILHIDITLIGKKPSIHLKKHEMIANIAQILSLSPHHISFKARSSNNVGETGQGKAIEAFVLVTLQSKGLLRSKNV